MCAKHTGPGNGGTGIETVFSGHFSYSIAASSSLVPDSSCIVEIVRYLNGVYGVMMTEDKHSRGPSITNACDRIATQIYNALLSDAPSDKIVWIEHCPASRNYKGHIDIVQFRQEVPQNRRGIADQPDNIGLVFTSPRWQRFFDAPHMSHIAFLHDYSFILKELCTASMIFSVRDKKGYSWRVWANGSGFFIVSANPSAVLGKEMLDINGVIPAFNNNSHLIAEPEIEKLFNNALVKGFLNDEL